MRWQLVIMTGTMLVFAGRTASAQDSTRWQRASTLERGAFIGAAAGMVGGGMAGWMTSGMRRCTGYILGASCQVVPVYSRVRGVVIGSTLGALAGAAAGALISIPFRHRKTPAPDRTKPADRVRVIVTGSEFGLSIAL